MAGGNKKEKKESAHECCGWGDAFFNFFAIKDRGVTKVLAMITLVGTPIFVILVNTFLSYRLDPAGFFVEHSTYSYGNETVLTPRESYNSLWWTHKIMTMTWSIMILTHMMVITLWGFVGGIHELFGFIVIMSAFISATAGLNMEVEGKLRYDNFTRVFIYMAAATTYLLILGFIITRSFKIVICGKRIGHHWFGYPLMIPPVGMLIQFIIYSFGLLISGDSDDDYLWWRISMWVCMFIATIISINFIANARWSHNHGHHDDDKLLEIDGFDGDRCCADGCTHSDRMDRHSSSQKIQIESSPTEDDEQ
eukprot:TRINITY_DN6070_c0_g1_i1.p1 TRINITY_DN6070_c0_g1~~TRINITY_DN6070_c0_g1_i1.p1  ORF type:complete len:308 (+),score=50.89 TRINITY_DN6070_c0_g1_i1:68-991(+)